MARHHKKRKVGAKKGHRRRHVGAGGKLEQAVLTGVGLVLGAIGTPYLVQGGNTMASGWTGMPEWLVPTGVGIIGGGVAYMGEKMPLVKGLGYGMLGVGAVMAANQMGLNEPGISGLASSNNAPAGTRALSNAVGCNKMGGPGAYLNHTVGARKAYRRTMSVGALITD